MSSSNIRVVNPSSSTSSHFSSSQLQQQQQKQEQQNNIFLQDIHSTIIELQFNLMEHHRNELNLRTTMNAQSEQLLDLRASLDVERSRNQRLAKLIRRVDSTTSCSSTDGGSEDSAGSMEYSRWRHSRSPIDAFESISPLLMQHRYQELSTSYKKGHRQLAKKDAKLRETQCEIEMLRAKYDNLMDEYKGVLKRVEQLCCKYLRLHTNKNRQILKLKEALEHATQCIMSDSNFDENDKQVLRQNLQYFIRSLKRSIHEEIHDTN